MAELTAKERTEKLEEIMDRYLDNPFFPKEVEVVEEIKGEPRYFIKPIRRKQLIHLILQACKEAGLKFVEVKYPPDSLSRVVKNEIQEIEI